MPGARALRKIQIGTEVTPGTAVVASAVWRGTGVGDDLRVIERIPEDIGILMPSDRQATKKLLAQLKMDSQAATFEQLPYILCAGVDGTATGATDGPGTDKIWTAAFPTTTQRVPKTYTLEAGDNQQAEEMEYGFVQDFTLDGAVGELWQVGATWIGRQWIPTTYTGSLAAATVHEMPFLNSKFYIDAVTALPASTNKAATLLAAKLAVKTGFIPVFAGDGELFFSIIKQVEPEVTLDITFEHDGTATAEKTAWRAETARMLRILCATVAPATPGTTYQKYSMIIDLVGKWSKFSVLDERDGNDVVTGTFVGRYNATAASSGRIIVVNESATLP